MTPGETSEDRPCVVVPPSTGILGLARSWFPGARWLREPASAEDREMLGRPLSGARFRGASASRTAAAGALELTAGATLVGPEPVGEHDAARFSLPRAWLVYRLDGPTPETEGWLHAVARHAGGAVLAGGVLTRPAVGIRVSLLISSRRALSAGEALALVRRVAPGAVLLASDDEGYLLEVPSSYDGSVLIDVRTTPRGAEHRFRWISPTGEPDDGAHNGGASLDAIARERLVPVVAKIALRLLEAVAGEATDADGLVVTTTELERRAQR